MKNNNQFWILDLRFMIYGLSSCLQLITRYSLLATHNSLLVTRNSQLATRYLILILSILISPFSFSQDSTKINNLNEVVVKSTRANEKTGMAFTNVYQKELSKQNLGQDIPYLLNQLPSVVTTSDAGAGVGYTGIRIRGSDPTRINVTVNGVPYNDSESQGVYWVNIPDFTSSVQSIQVQRGVGTSTNGAGAFGASINVNTLGYEKEAFGETNVSAGSFNTLKTNVLASTGLLNGHFVVDTRLSRIVSDGFVDRASSNLKSFYVSGGYYGKNSFIRLNVFSGYEKTYQSWYGTPESAAKGDIAGINAYADRNYISDADRTALLTRGRKYNFYTYDNQTDNYQQDHYQLISSFKLSKNWQFSPTLHFTHGKGYYEEYKDDQKFSNYGLNDVVIGNETIKNTDLIRRKWLDNNFYGAVYSFDYEGDSKLKANIGGGWNQYDGKHFGEIIWAKYTSNGGIRQHYYDNTGSKQDFNIYGKVFYQIYSALNTYVDLQYRAVSISNAGIADKLQDITSSKSYQFFNPKLGFNYVLSNLSSVYASYAVGNKEPSRQDFIDNAPTVPKPENLQDLELGYRYNNKKLSAEANYYFMNYKNQLVLTGQVNLVGEAIRVNVPKSYRSGIELQAAYKPSTHWLLGANLNLSQNKINNFTEVIANYDGEADKINTYKKSDISFSPNIVAGGTLTYKANQNFEISLLPKYVGKQYLDNTSSESRKLDAFFMSNLRTSYTIHPKLMKELTFSLLVNNIFNKKYEANGYTYSYIYDRQVITENFLYPQAGTNFLAGVKMRF